MKTKMKETEFITSDHPIVLQEDLDHARYELKWQKREAAEKQAALEKEIASIKAAARRDAKNISTLVERSESVGPALEEVSRVRFELRRLKIMALSQTAIVVAYFALKFSGILF